MNKCTTYGLVEGEEEEEEGEINCIRNVFVGGLNEISMPSFSSHFI